MDTSFTTTSETHAASKLKGLAWLLGILLLATGLAFGVSPLMRIVPWRWELALAHRFPVTEKTCKGSAENAALLDRLVARLYPVEADDDRISVNVHVVDNPAVNAYARLGGQILIDQGLLRQARSADEIAGVLAHEIEHVKRRHILENAAMHLMTAGGVQLVFSGQANGLALIDFFLHLGFTRAQEVQADEGGLRRLQVAHIDNHGFAAFFRRMQDEAEAPGFLSDHPQNRDRLAMVAKFDNADTAPVMTDQEWTAFRNFCP